MLLRLLYPFSCFVSGLFFLVLLTVTCTAEAAECRGKDAMAASEALAKGYFKDALIFHPSRVLKVHSPSGKREVASYVQTGDKRYSIFTLVSEQCEARFIKRTRQKD
jgi:hypothetical protein